MACPLHNNKHRLKVVAVGLQDDPMASGHLHTYQFCFAAGNRPRRGSREPIGNSGRWAGVHLEPIGNSSSALRLASAGDIIAQLVTTGGPNSQVMGLACCCRIFAGSSRRRRLLPDVAPIAAGSQV